MKKKSKSLATASDAVLIRCSRLGVKGAFDTLVSRHTPRLLKYLHAQLRNSDEEKDALQDTWELVIRALRNGRYRERGLFEKWINKIAFLKGMKVRCRNRKLVRCDLDVLEAIQDEQEEMTSEDLAEKMKPAFNRLSKKQQQVVTMRITEGLPFKEIGPAVGLTEGKTRVYCWRAIQRMRKYFLKSVTKRGGGGMLRYR